MLDDYNIGRSDKQAKQWKQELEEAQKNGSEQGQEYIDNLVKDLMTGKIKTDQQGDEIGKGFKSNLEKNIAYFKSLYCFSKLSFSLSVIASHALPNSCFIFS